MAINEAQVANMIDRITAALGRISASDDVNENTRRLAANADIVTVEAWLVYNASTSKDCVAISAMSDEDFAHAVLVAVNCIDLSSPSANRALVAKLSTLLLTTSVHAISFTSAQIQ